MSSHDLSQTLTTPQEHATKEVLTLDGIEPIRVLKTHMSDDELHDIEDRLVEHDAPLTYDISEARLFIGKVQMKRRAVIELRALGIRTTEYVPRNRTPSGIAQHSSDGCHEKNAAERQKQSNDKKTYSGGPIDLTEDSTTESESGSATNIGKSKENEQVIAKSSSATQTSVDDSRLYKVIRLSWLFNSVQAGRALPLEDYLVYIGQQISGMPTIEGSAAQSNASMKRSVSNPANHLSGKPQTIRTEEILNRARAERQADPPKRVPQKRFHGAVDAVDQGRGYASTSQKPRLLESLASEGLAPLLRRSTPEYDLDLSNDIPRPPEWVQRGYKYACQRSTPVNNPNPKFIDMLKSIRLTRTLTGDEIGVRAYSTAVASLSAYPHILTSPREILALPGCSAKIAALFAEWKNNGEQDVAAVRESKNDKRLQILRLFHEIWGVGHKTARDFYDRGWRDLDDIVEHGWTVLTRVQQIGVKFYEEFQVKIPRSEVEHIRDVVHEHVQRVCGRPEGVRTCVVGGYRRGKAESGDADIMVSHLDEARLLDAVDDIVASLHEDGWITHSLGTTRSNSRRGQQTLPYQGPGAGSGFDSLDKAMVVWQDPSYHSSDASDDENPNPHRRVDIILSPWRTIGCAVLGWSAGTTFERDLRRYAKHEKNWKFDSSGIRDRATGEVVDVEAAGGRSETVDEAERKVFAALGLDYKEPRERCTG